MERYLIDTNVISDYLSASLPLPGIALLDEVVDAVPRLPVITQIELLCWNTDETTEQYVRNFIADSLVFDITSEVINHCVSLRKGKKIKTPDAIIAATALAHNLTIITNNEKDFAGIKGLHFVNPHKL